MADDFLIDAPDPERIDFLAETFRMVLEAAERDQRRAVPMTKPEPVERREYLTIRRLSDYSGFSPRTIQEWTRDIVDPLPTFAPGGGKVVVRRRDFDEWAARRMARQERGSAVGGIVRGVLDDLRGGR